ncbi:MAG: preprotein translocase subunit SecY, partial [Ruminiclostridium sp.]|nr:preprotein translocase subunit SecY [Ruminiclostridium sp.]
MFEVFRNAWKDVNLRKKILYTLFIIVIFRLGSNIFVPFLDMSAISNLINDESLLGFLDTMTGGSLSNGTLLAMSITPYINASIIIQLLAVAIPALEKLQKEGDEGRKRLNFITKITSLALAVLQAVGFYFLLRSKGAVKYTEGFDSILAAVTIVICFVAGASLIIWLGDQINEKGIGNGISIILFAGIVARMPVAVFSLVQSMTADMKNAILVPIVAVIF